MHRNTAVIIPTLENNRYNPAGDLVEFGDLTLLEWKITQVKNFINAENIFLSTPSAKISKIARPYGVNVIKRIDCSDMSGVTRDCAKKINADILIWTYCTSPFISSNDFKNMLNKFLKLGKRYDSLISVLKMQEFFVFKKRALNFEMAKSTSRKSVEPVFRVTNGCFITSRDTCIKHGNHFGLKPFLYEIDPLAAVEIKEAADLDVAGNLISLFFKRGLHV